MSNENRPTKEMSDLLRRSGSAQREVALAAQHDLAVALQVPLRQGRSKW